MNAIRLTAADECVTPPNHLLISDGFISAHFYTGEQQEERVLHHDGSSEAVLYVAINAKHKPPSFFFFCAFVTTNQGTNQCEGCIYIMLFFS